ncbi:hypothetical protein ACNQF7_10110 [Flavobacterium sp. RSP29]|uniref:hypothetical protein n=1 Tax=Flavobacterium sp. RSP29 TaxID=3401731 RepID=UPI003AAF4425
MKTKLIALTLVFSLLISCGARKTEKSKTSEAEKTEASIIAYVKKTDESNVKKTEKTSTDDKNQTTIKETTYELVDPTKPGSVIDPDGRKTDLNNSKKTTRETTKNNNTKTDNTKTSNESNKSEVSDQSESNSKSATKKTGKVTNIDRKAFNPLNLLWLLIPLGFLLVWMNKNKIIMWTKKIWWI